jgi:hypothetical protein
MAALWVAELEAEVEPEPELGLVEGVGEERWWGRGRGRTGSGVRRVGRWFADGDGGGGGGGGSVGRGMWPRVVGVAGVVRGWVGDE